MVIGNGNLAETDYIRPRQTDKTSSNIVEYNRFDCDQTLSSTSPFNIARHPSDLFNLIQQGGRIIQQGTQTR